MLLARHFLDDQSIHRSGRAAAPQSPRVSVVLPTFARSRSGLLQRAINSVLRQTVTDFEVLVIDDGSQDGTADLIRSYQERDPRIIHVRHERNCGLPALRCNEGIELARGEFVAFQFDDDEWSPRLLEVLLAAADAQPRPALICGQALLHWDGTDLALPLHAVNLGYLSERNYVPNNAILVPRAFFNRVGMYDPHIVMRRSTDWDLWQRLAEVVPIHTEPQIVATIHGQQDGAIHQHASFDQGLHCVVHEIPRNHLLTPATWRDYPLDSLRIGNTELHGDYRTAAYEQHIRPYYLRHRHDLPVRDQDSAGAFPLNAPPGPRDVVVLPGGTDGLGELAGHLRQRATYRIAAGDGLAPLFADLVVGDRDEDLRPAHSAGVATALLSGTAPASGCADAVWSAERTAHPRTLPYRPGSVGAFEAAARATEFHALVRDGRHPETGRPVVVLVLPDHYTPGYDSSWLARVGCLQRHGVDVVAALPETARVSEPGRSVLAALEAAGVACEWLGLPAIAPGEVGMLEGAPHDIEVVAAVLARHRPVLVESMGYLPALGSACRRVRVPHLATLAASFPLLRGAELAGHAVFLMGNHCPPDPWSKMVAAGLRWRCQRGLVGAEFFAAGRQAADTPGPLNALDRPLRILLVEPRPAEATRTLLTLTKVLDRVDLPAASWTLLVLDTEVAGHDPRVVGCPLPNDRLELVNTADLVLVMPGAEGVPHVVEQALAAGTLVVAVESPALREVVADGRTGLLGPSAAFEDLTALLRRAAALPAEQRAAIRRQGIELASAEFSEERYAAELFQTYTQAVKEYRGPETPGTRREASAVPVYREAGLVPRVEILDRCLRYTVVPAWPCWAGLEVLLQAEDLSVPLPIHLEVCDSRGQLVRKATAEVEPGNGQRVVAFHFAPLACPQGEAYTVLLRPTRPCGAGIVRLFEAVPAVRSLFERACRKVFRGLRRTGLTCRLLIG